MTPGSADCSPLPAENSLGNLRGEVAIDLYRTMARIRAFEIRAERLFLDGELPGFIHVSIGQEAVAAGVCAALRTDDYLTTTHRGHGHTLAKGARADAMMAELFGRASGVCAGRGGSMHIADFSVGMLGANAIVAGGLGIAVGAALNAKMTASTRIAATFFGDGATARGPFAESLNLAQLWNLPVVVVCENNGWASTTRSAEALAQPRVAKRAMSFGMHTLEVDGNDVFAVAAAASEAASRARQGDGPTLIEANTYRLRGHFVGDPTTYYDKAELQAWTLRDPITRAAASLIQSGLLDAEALRAVDQDAHKEIDLAVEFAKAALLPDPSTLRDFLFADEIGQSDPTVLSYTAEGESQ